MRSQNGGVQPPVHVSEADYDLIAGLALQTEHRSPGIAAMLFGELDRAKLYTPGALPSDAITIGSSVEYVEERNGQLHRVQIVLPVDANIAEGKISILTPMGAALFGLKEGSTIAWPDLHGTVRHLKIVKVTQPAEQL